MFITFILAVFLTLPLKAALALQVLPPCTATGNCQLCDFVLGFMNIMRWGFGVVGTIALLFIIIAGISLILAQGSPDKIKKAKNRIVAVVIGLAIMLLAWQITNFLVATFTLNNNPDKTASQQTKPRLFSNNGTIWYNICSGSVDSCTGKGDGAPCSNSSGYCLTDPTSKIATCQTDQTACAFLASDFNFKKYYEGYTCQSKDGCDFNRDLGPGYCGNSNSNCCARKNP